jgi:hypothetical protein
MSALIAGTDIVWVQSHRVLFPMRDPKTRKDLVCVQTLAGFEKILGRKSFTLEEFRRTFYDNRRGFEALASFLYDVESDDHYCHPGRRTRSD